MSIRDLILRYLNGNANIEEINDWLDRETDAESALEKSLINEVEVCLVHLKDGHITEEDMKQRLIKFFEVYPPGEDA